MEGELIYQGLRESYHMAIVKKRSPSTLNKINPYNRQPLVILRMGINLIRTPLDCPILIGIILLILLLKMLKYMMRILGIVKIQLSDFSKANSPYLLVTATQLKILTNLTPYQKIRS